MLKCGNASFHDGDQDRSIVHASLIVQIVRSTFDVRVDKSLAEFCSNSHQGIPGSSKDFLWSASRGSDGS